MYDERPKNIKIILMIAKGLIGMKNFDKVLSILNYQVQKNTEVILVKTLFLFFSLGYRLCTVVIFFSLLC